MIDFSQTDGFEWDEGNIQKNRDKHGVDTRESEEVFVNQPLLIYFDNKHSETESRFYVLGKTNNNRFLFLAFTMRKNRIRIISARDMNKKEKIHYEND